MTELPKAHILDIFEHGEGFAFRFLIPGDGPDALHELTKLSAITTAGDPLNAEVLNLGLSASFGGNVISVITDRGFEPFDLLYDGCQIATVDRRSFDRLSHDRDIRMVNPGIDDVYGRWLVFSRSQMKDMSALNSAAQMPLMSIVVPLFNTPSDYLSDMLSSVQSQLYPNWELILVNASPENESMRAILDQLDDDRIKELVLDENLGIAGNTNAGILASSGEFISFLDHDDIIEPDLLLEYALYINEHPDVEILYCDEDSFDVVDGKFYSPLFKPDVNIDFLCTHNYIVHCLTLRRSLIDKVGMSSDETSGAQDLDLTLKAVRAGAKFGHIPRVLYHWRMHEGSTNGGATGGKSYADMACEHVLGEHFKTIGVPTEIASTDIPYVFKPDFKLTFEKGLLVVTYADREDLDACLGLFFEMKGADKFDVVAVGSSQKIASDTFESCRSVRSMQAELHEVASVIDRVISESEAELIVLCDASIRWIDKTALEELASYALRSDVGFAGPKELTAEGLTLAQGAFVDEGRFVLLNQWFADDMGGGYLGTGNIPNDVSALPANCLAFKRSVFEALGGLAQHSDDLHQSVTGLCFQARKFGLLNVYVPYAQVQVVKPFVFLEAFDNALNGEGASRFWQKWDDSWKRDVLFSPNVDYSSGYPRLRTSLMPKESLFDKVKRKLFG